MRLPSAKRLKVGVAAIGAVAFGSCMATPSEHDLYSAGFRYDDFQIMCGHEVLVAEELLRELTPSLLDYIEGDENLRGVNEVVDLSRPNITGYKKLGSESFLKYMFGTFLMPEVLIPGEGGIMVVVDPCKKRLLYVNYFRYP